MRQTNFKLSAIMAFLLFSMAACQNNGNRDGNLNDTITLGDQIQNEEQDMNRSFSSFLEKDFVTDVIEANIEEMTWLRAGMNMGTDADLKSQADQMMRDHQQMDRGMKDFAFRKKISLENLDTNEVVRIYYQQGNNWDAEWADEIGDMHRKLIRRFERAQKRIQDAELAGIISKTLPTLHAHLDMAEKLEARLDSRKPIYTK